MIVTSGCSRTIAVRTRRAVTWSPIPSRTARGCANSCSATTSAMASDIDSQMALPICRDVMLGRWMRAGPTPSSTTKVSPPSNDTTIATMPNSLGVKSLESTTSVISWTSNPPTDCPNAHAKPRISSWRKGGCFVGGSALMQQRYRRAPVPKSRQGRR